MTVYKNQRGVLHDFSVSWDIVSEMLSIQVCGNCIDVDGYGGRVQMVAEIDQPLSE